MSKQTKEAISLAEAVIRDENVSCFSTLRAAGEIMCDHARELRVERSKREMSLGSIATQVEGIGNCVDEHAMESESRRIANLLREMISPEPPSEEFQRGDDK